MKVQKMVVRCVTRWPYLRGIAKTRRWLYTRKKWLCADQKNVSRAELLPRTPQVNFQSSDWLYPQIIGDVANLIGYIPKLFGI